MLYFQVTRTGVNPIIKITSLKILVIGKVNGIWIQEWAKDTTNTEVAGQAGIEDCVNVRTDDDLVGKNQIRNADHDGYYNLADENEHDWSTLHSKLKYDNFHQLLVGTKTVFSKTFRAVHRCHSTYLVWKKCIPERFGFWNLFHSPKNNLITQKCGPKNNCVHKNNGGSPKIYWGYNNVTCQKSAFWVLC